MGIEIGELFEREITLTEEMVNSFACVTGDTNPIHLDEDYAGKTVFKNRVVHGMLLGGLISSILGNEFPGRGTIYLSQSLKFLRPVYINEIIKFHVEIVEIKRNGWVVLKTLCYNKESLVVLKGEAVVENPISN